MVRMERGCHSDRCRGRDFHIVRKRRRLGRKTKAQMKRNRAFYSKWSRWRPCSQLCLTTRTKTCRYPAVCGAVQVRVPEILFFKNRPQTNFCQQIRGK